MNLGQISADFELRGIIPSACGGIVRLCVSETEMQVSRIKCPEEPEENIRRAETGYQAETTSGYSNNRALKPGTGGYCFSRALSISCSRSSPSLRVSWAR